MTEPRDLGLRLAVIVTVTAALAAVAAHIVATVALEGVAASLAAALAWSVAGAAATAAVVVTAKRIADRRRRRTLVLAASALGLWTLGALLRLTNLAVDSRVPFLDAAADTLWCGFAVATTAALILRAPPKAFSLRLFVLDAVPLVLLAVQLARVISGTGFYAPLADQVSVTAFASLFPLMGVVAAQLVLVERRRDAPLLLFGGGAILLAAVGFLWSYETVGTAPTRSAIDPLWTLGILGIAAGALLRARSPEIVPTPESAKDIGIRAVPPAAALLGLIVLQDVLPRDRYPLVIWFTVISFLAFAARYYLARRDSEALLEREQDARRLAQRADQLKDDFLALVSHELRTPLTSIRGYLELVLDEPEKLDDDHLRSLRTVERNSNRLLRLVSDLLFVAQIDSGGLSVSNERVSLDQLAEESVDAAGPAAEAAEISLELRAGSRAEIQGDHARLGQLIDNLVSNAIKFTPSGGRVVVRTMRAGEAALIEVEDTGMGIPAAEQARLFERFFRARAATEGAIQGTGLGLAIAHAIAEAHDGGIELESTVGRGTVFRVRLPIAYAEGR